MAEKRTKVKHIIPIILRTKLTEIIGSIPKKLFGENTAKKGEENQEYNDRDQTILLEKKIYIILIREFLVLKEKLSDGHISKNYHKITKLVIEH